MPAAPILMTSPEDLRGHTGGKVIIPCQAVGDPEPTITWMFNEKEITFDENSESTVYTQLPSGSLRIESFSADHMGDYQCKALNMMGETVSRPARMTMEETSSSQLNSDGPKTTVGQTATSSTTNSPGQPHLNHIPEDVTIPLNDSIILDCAERGTYMTDREVNQIMDKLNISLPVLQYIFNIRPRLHLKVRLVIIFRIHYTFLNAVGVVFSLLGPCLGKGDVEFNLCIICYVAGGQSIMWHFNGVKLSQSTEKQQILGNGTLVIRQATLSDAGHYKCTVTGATAGQVEVEANVRVIGTYFGRAPRNFGLRGISNSIYVDEIVDCRWRL